MGKYGKQKGLKNSGLNGDLNRDLCDASAVLYQFSYQANWELVVMSVDCKPVDDGYRYIYDGNT